MPHARSYPRERIRATLADMVAAGQSLGHITLTQLRIRLGGGSWRILREELEQARAAAAPAPGRDAGRLREQVPAELAEQAAAIERLLDQLGRALRALVTALRD